MMKSVLYLLIVGACMLSCGENDNKEIVEEKTSLTFLTGLTHLPKLQSADSIQVLYYDNPDGDPKRYTRFFKHLNKGDGDLLKAVKNSLDTGFVVFSEIKDCRSEGKLFLYAGVDPIKTVYFSGRGDTCSYLYYIQDGQFYYFPLKEKLRDQLNQLKPLAKEPEAEIIEN